MFLKAKGRATLFLKKENKGRASPFSRRKLEEQ